MPKNPDYLNEKLENCQSEADFNRLILLKRFWKRAGTADSKRTILKDTKAKNWPFIASQCKQVSREKDALLKRLGISKEIFRAEGYKDYTLATFEFWKALLDRNEKHSEGKILDWEWRHRKELEVLLKVALLEVQQIANPGSEDLEGKYLENFENFQENLKLDGVDKKFFNHELVVDAIEYIKEDYNVPDEVWENFQYKLECDYLVERSVYISKVQKQFPDFLIAQGLAKNEHKLDLCENLIPMEKEKQKELELNERRYGFSSGTLKEIGAVIEKFDSFFAEEESFLPLSSSRGKSIDKYRNQLVETIIDTTNIDEKIALNLANNMIKIQRMSRIEFLEMVLSQSLRQFMNNNMKEATNCGKKIVEISEKKSLKDFHIEIILDETGVSRQEFDFVIQKIVQYLEYSRTPDYDCADEIDAILQVTEPLFTTTYQIFRKSLLPAIKELS